MPWHTSGKFAFSPDQRHEQETVSGHQHRVPVGCGKRQGIRTWRMGHLRQWQERGAQVRKGEKATLVVFWKFANNASETDDGDDTPKAGSRLLFTRGYSVFNAAQVDGYSPKADAETPIEQRIEQAEQFFAGINARVIHQGNRAFYSPADDTITLPPFAAFFTAMDYYSTRAHETGHWTSRADRCDRELGKRFGDSRLQR